MPLCLRNTCFHLVRNTWLFQVTFPLKNNVLNWGVKCSIALLFLQYVFFFFNMELRVKYKGLTRVLCLLLFMLVVSHEVCTKWSFLETHFIQSSVTVWEVHASLLCAIIALGIFQMWVLVLWIWWWKGRIRWETLGIPLSPQKFTDKELVMNLSWHPLHFGKLIWERTLGWLRTEDPLIMLSVYVIREDIR